jgi:hypothetical protein
VSAASVGDAFSIVVLITLASVTVAMVVISSFVVVIVGSFTCGDVSAICVVSICFSDSNL